MQAVEKKFSDFITLQPGAERGCKGRKDRVFVLPRPKKILTDVRSVLGSRARHVRLSFSFRFEGLGAPAVSKDQL